MRLPFWFQSMVLCLVILSGLCIATVLAQEQWWPNNKSQSNLAHSASLASELWKPIWSKEMNDCASYAFPPGEIDLESPLISTGRIAMKNRHEFPDPAKVEKRTIEEFKDLPVALSRPTAWSEKLRRSICESEQVPVSVEGELVFAFRQADGSTDGLPIGWWQHSNQPDYYDPLTGMNRLDSAGDFHLEIRNPSDKDYAETRGSHVVVEITPLYLYTHPGLYGVRKLARKWSDNADRNLRTIVRVTGWLYQDDHYPSDTGDETQAGRNSSWEIHPVTKLEVQDVRNGLKIWVDCTAITDASPQADKRTCKFREL
jgi:hypothetical protein